MEKLGDLCGSLSGRGFLRGFMGGDLGFRLFSRSRSLWILVCGVSPLLKIAFLESDG